MADLREITKAIQRGIERSVTPKELLRIGRAALLVIQRRTRRGFGVKRSGVRRRRLKPLSAQYVARRRRALLSRFTSPGKSNLTFSGQMLSSMKAKSVKPGTVTITFDNRRNDGKRNSDIAEFVSKERPFNNLARKEVEALVEDYDKSLQAQIDKALRGL